MKTIEEVLRENNVSFHRAFSGTIYLYFDATDEAIAKYGAVDHKDVVVDTEIIENCRDYGDGTFKVRISDHKGYDGDGVVGVNVTVKPMPSNKIGEGIIIDGEALAAIGIECDSVIEWAFE